MPQLIFFASRLEGISMKCGIKDTSAERIIKLKSHVYAIRRNTRESCRTILQNKGLST